MYCKNCGAQNPENSSFCGACGAPITADNEDNFSENTVAVETAENNEAVNEEQYFEEPPKKKRSAVPVIIIAALLAVALIAGCIIGFWPYISNAAMKLASPEKHQAFVYKNAAKDLGNMLFNNAMEDGDKSQGTATVSLSDTAAELLEDYGVEADLTAINDFEIDYEYSVKDNNQAVTATAKHPEIELNAEVFTNEKKEEITVLLPEFNEEAVSLDADDLEIQLLPATAIMPEKKLAKRVLSEYAETLFLNAEDVNRGKGSYEINGKSTKALCFETEVSEELAAKAMLAVLEKAKEDKELEEYFDDVLLPYMDVNDDYDDGIDSLIEELEEGDFDDDTAFILYTYINAKGDIIAIEIDINDGSENIRIVAGRYTKGKNVEYELSVTSVSDGEVVDTLAFVAEGTIVRNKLDLTTSLVVEDEEMLKIKLEDYDLKSYKKGCPKGKMTLSGGIFEEIADEPALRNLSIIYEFNTKKKSYDHSLVLAAKDGELLSVNYSGKIKNAKNIELHSDTTDDAEAWAEDFDESVIEDLADIFNIDY